MKIRKHSGEPDGWSTAVAVTNCGVFDDEGRINYVVAGRKYYVQGDLDPALFAVEKKAVKPKPDKEEE